jgi:hypothetical protein
MAFMEAGMEMFISWLFLCRGIKILLFFRMSYYYRLGRVRGQEDRIRPSLFGFLLFLARWPDRLSPAESAGRVFHTKDLPASSKGGEGSPRAGHEEGEELPARSDEI